MESKLEKEARPFEGVDEQLKSGMVNCSIFWIVSYWRGHPRE